MPKYTYTRSSIVEESFTVEAGSQEEALELVMDEGKGVTIAQRGWIDWADDEYTLEDVEDEVVTFIRSKEPA